MRASITAESLQVVRRFLVIAAVLLVPATVQAQSITLAWDASADQAVVGYVVHVGVNPGSYGQTFDVSGRSNTTFRFTQAVPGQRYYFAVSAYDANNRTSGLSNTVSWKINVAPAFVPLATQTGAVGAATSLQLTATDDGDPLTYTATGLPAGLSLNQSTGAISGAPTTAGTYTVTATVSDGQFSAQTTFVWIIAPRLSVTGLTTSVPSPQRAGTPIVLIAAATGGTSAYEFQFLQTLGGSTTVVRGWGNNAYTWTPSQAGTYGLTVRARTLGTTNSAGEDSRTISFVASPPSMTVTALTSNLASPQTVNTAITFNAAATGGVAPYQYKYLLTVGGGSVTLREWGTNANFNWLPTLANAFAITVWVRSAGQTADVAEATRSINYTILPGFGVAGIASSVPSPQPVGTAVTFTASTTGALLPPQYKWWLFDGSSWTVARDWSTSATFTWTAPRSGSSYRIGVWARPATITGDISTYNLSVPYTFADAPVTTALRITSFASNLSSPRVTGTTIGFIAAASGGTAPYQFKFLVNNGSGWTTVRNWSGSSTYSWLPMTPGSYQVAVWARNATTTADVADAVASQAYTITSPTSGTPLVISAITANVPSPQPADAPITFTAVVSGGTAPYQYKWWLFDGSSWAIAQDWSGNNFTWTPPSPSSRYRVGVWVRDSRTTGDVSDVNLSLPLEIRAASAPAPPTVTSFTSSLASPRLAGTMVTFAATASGGAAPYQFKFLVNDGRGWTTTRNWSGSNSYSWLPLIAGTYQVAVWVRNSTTTADVAEASASTAYTITAPATGSPLAITSLASNLASPQLAGTAITFTTNVSGGTAPYQYKWLLFDGSQWVVAQNWSGSASYTWTPAAAGSNYRVGVWVRNATTLADVSDAAHSIPFSVTAPVTSGGGSSSATRITALTTSMSSPQRVGTTLTFSAIVTGGSGSYQYKWWLFDGSRWILHRDWSTSPTYTWTTTAPNPSYRMGVWVRDSTTTSDDSSINLSVPFWIVP